VKSTDAILIGVLVGAAIAKLGLITKRKIANSPISKPWLKILKV
jgi:hypothetical protein